LHLILIRREYGLNEGGNETRSLERESAQSLWLVSCRLAKGIGQDTQREEVAIIGHLFHPHLTEKIDIIYKKDCSDDFTHKCAEKVETVLFQSHSGSVSSIISPPTTAKIFTINLFFPY
jgi:hypothetical protein